MDLESMKCTIFDAAKASLGKDFKKVQKFLQKETDRLATALFDIANAPPGTYTLIQAQIEVNGHKKSFESTLLAAKGMALISVQVALSSALSSVKEFVNTKTGLPLL